MRNPFSFWLILLACVGLPIAVGTATGGAGGIAYVISASMEPTLNIGDGFLLWPTSEPKIGDVITFRPLVLQADRVTHRIYAETPAGFITLGDNNQYTDQVLGEPPVTVDRIIGRAVTWRGKLTRLPGIGIVSTYLRELLGQNLKQVALYMAGLGALFLVMDALKVQRVRRPRRRLRLGHLYAAFVGLTAAALFVTMLIGSRTHSVSYLASQNPGTSTNHVPVGRPGMVRVAVTNMGWLPVHHFAYGLGEAEVTKAPASIGPRSVGTVELITPTHDQPGWYRQYLHVYNYPPVLPRFVLAPIVAVDPYLAMMASLAMVTFVLWLPTRFLNLWAPLHGDLGGLGTQLWRRWQRWTRWTPQRRRSA